LCLGKKREEDRGKASSTNWGKPQDLLKGLEEEKKREGGKPQVELPCNALGRGTLPEKGKKSDVTGAGTCRQRLERRGGKKESRIYCQYHGGIDI